MSRFAIVFFAATVCAFSPAIQAAPQPCDQLAQLALPNTTITSAQTIAAGTFFPATSRIAVASRQPVPLQTTTRLLPRNRRR